MLRALAEAWSEMILRAWLHSLERPGEARTGVAGAAGARVEEQVGNEQKDEH